jgi:hypothetical protein
MRKKTKRTTPNFSSLQTGYHRADCWGNRPKVRSLAFSLLYFQLLFLFNIFILI